MVFGQSRQVTGTVTDAVTNQPIAGATIKAVGTSFVAQTDVNGHYEIGLNESTKFLFFTYIGYSSQQVAAAAGTVDVQLMPSAADLEEVVVVGYGTQIKKDITGSVASVKMADLENVPLQTVEAGLQGRAPGVFVNTSSGKLGQALQIRVRGISSISAGTQPLFVIDGVPMVTEALGTYDEPDNPLAAISPDDIESMEVLKDGAASAIYGSRASNGVVLISTKKGKAGRTKIDLNYFAGFSDPTNKGDFLNADQYRELLSAALVNGGYIGPDPDEQYPDVSAFWTDWTGTDDWDKNYNTNWVNEGMRRGSLQQGSLSISGGDAKTRFNASGSYSDTKGIIIGNRFKRTSGRIGVDHSAFDFLDIGGTLNINKIDNYRVNSDNAFSNPLQLNALPPIQPIRDENGELYNYTVYYNNLIDLENGNNLSSTYRTFGTAYANARITPDLLFRSEYGMDFQNLEEDLYLGMKTQDGGDSGGYGFSYQARSVNFNTNNTLSYSKVFNDIHNLNLLAGMSYQEQQFRFTMAEGKNFPSDQFRKITAAAVKSDASSSATSRAIVSYFARANYKLMDRYLFEASVRTDGSSRFGKEYKYATFPGASLGWVISEENFLKESQALNFLKLRASYGLTGNENIANFASRTLYRGANYAGTPGTVAYQLGDPRLTWEQTAQTNLGLDFGLLSDRISGTVEAYHKKTTDMLLDMPIVSTSGFTTVFRNIGSLENKGLELTLNSKNFVGEFKWSTSFNISWNRNKILKLVNGQPIYPGGRYLGRLEEGMPYGFFYGKAYAGVDPENGDALYYLDETRKTTTNEYSEAADQEIGDPNPSFFGGFGNKFSYKNFDLDIQTQFVSGNDIYNAAGGFQSANGDYFDNQTTDQMNYWKNPGDITMIPQPRFDSANGTRPSSRYIQDGSYFRIKNLVLGYNLPNETVTKLKMQRARVYVSATNLLTLTDYNGYDPEINTTFAGAIQLGTDFYTAPQPRTITFGINVGF